MTMYFFYLNPQFMVEASVTARQEDAFIGVFKVQSTAELLNLLNLLQASSDAVFHAMNTNNNNTNLNAEKERN